MSKKYKFIAFLIVLSVGMLFLNTIRVEILGKEEAINEVEYPGVDCGFSDTCTSSMFAPKS